MKFTCKTNNLKEAIGKVERIVSKQTTLPILANILIKTENGRLIIGATNLEIAIRSYVGAKIEKEGEITVPSRILSGFLLSIKDDIIDCELNGTELSVNSENHKIKIKGMEAKDFPIIPQIPTEHFLRINSSNFNKAIPGLLVSVAHNDIRQELNGILIKFSLEEIVFASTDSFRLSEARIKLPKEAISGDYEVFINNTPSIIIPSLTFSELQRIISGGDFELIISQNQLFIKNESVNLISRLISGNYPEYNQVLPEKYEIEVKINKGEFLNALKIASLVASNNNGEVRISNSKSNKGLKISAESVDSGENVSRIEAEISGPEFEVIFNCRYLLEGLNVVETETENVLLKLNPTKSPVIIKGLNLKNEEKEGFSYVIMPIIKG